MSPETVWMSAAAVVAAVVTLVLDVVLAVIGLVVVRKRSDTAGWLMAGAAAVFAGTVVASPLAYSGAAQVFSPSEYAGFLGVLNLSFSLVRAAGWVLLLVGIVKLATAGAGPGRG